MPVARLYHATYSTQLKLMYNACVHALALVHKLAISILSCSVWGMWGVFRSLEIFIKQEATLEVIITLVKATQQVM